MGASAWKPEFSCVGLVTEPKFHTRYERDCAGFLRLVSCGDVGDKICFSGLVGCTVEEAKSAPAPPRCHAYLWFFIFSLQFAPL